MARTRGFRWKGILAFLGALLLPAVVGATDETDDPVVLCVGEYQTPDEGRMQLARFEETYRDSATWEKRAAHLRQEIRKGLGLDPFPARCALNPIRHSRWEGDGYSVENVAFESLPGFYVTGNLYRPLGVEGPYAGIVSPHGHFGDVNGDGGGRFRADMQKRCAAMARMGAVVFAMDMVGWGESTQAPHRDSLALTLQVWNAVRAVDYLLSLGDVDEKRLAITGASGGGTQTFLTAAVDERIDVSAPVVMVSAYFFGGCPCESGLPIHKSPRHETNNTEIAALIAPKPLLIVSDGNDWTRHVPDTEYPHIQRIYNLYGHGDRVAFAHYPDEGHDYGYTKRLPVYRFFATHLALDLSRILNTNQEIDESFVQVRKPDELRVFKNDQVKAMPQAAGREAIEALLKEAQRR